MKYVIFTHGTLYMPVIFPDHVSHNQIVLKGCKIHSAGFVDVSRFGVNKVYGKSESLHIGPSSVDEKILRNVFLNSGTSAFLNYDDFEKRSNSSKD